MIIKIPFDCIYKVYIYIAVCIDSSNTNINICLKYTAVDEWLIVVFTQRVVYYSYKKWFPQRNCCLQKDKYKGIIIVYVHIVWSIINIYSRH